MIHAAVLRLHGSIRYWSAFELRGITVTSGVVRSGSCCAISKRLQNIDIMVARQFSQRQR